MEISPENLKKKQLVERFFYIPPIIIDTFIIWNLYSNDWLV